MSTLASAIDDLGDRRRPEIVDLVHERLVHRGRLLELKVAALDRIDQGGRGARDVRVENPIELCRHFSPASRGSS